MNPMNRLVTIAIIAISITGCARAVWTQAGATEADFNRDKSACSFEAARAGDPIFAAMFLPDCLRGRGWTQQKAE
jgi:hypothetical protein